MAVTASADISARIRTIIRRDLKLGPDIAVTDDMPFFGTDADVDSLDILLLLSSIEKEFGVKVPSEKVGREIFENVGTLTRFIAAQLGATTGPPASAGGVSASGGNPLDRLPHRDPFRFVSRVTSINPGDSAEAVWALTGKEPFFAGHFPGNPIIPGVLIAEALAQAAGLAVPATNGPTGGVLAHVDVRFEHPVPPPAEIVLRARLTRTIGTLHQFDVEASANAKVVARGTLALSCTPAR
jgi:3-hydroxyacyl-[acyl-carrier-protein] dehydratase